MSSVKIGLLAAVVLTIAPTLAAQQQHVQVQTRSMGWPSGWVVKQEATRLGLVLDYHADTVWIPSAEIVGIKGTPAPTLNAAPAVVLGNLQGPRVKVATHSPGWQTGVLAVQDSARFGLVLDGERDTTWLARSDVRDMQVSIGKRHAGWTGAAFGAMGGAIAGGVYGESDPASCTTDAFGFPVCSGVGALSGFFGGAVAGALLGGLVGSFITSDIWQRVDTQRTQHTSPRVGITPGPRGVAVGVTVMLR